MQKNFFIAFLALLVLVLAGLALHQRRQLESAAPSAPSAPAEPAPEPIQPVRQVRAPVVTPVPPARTPAATVPAEPTPAREPPGLASAMSEFVAMLEQPEFKEGMRAQQKLMIDQMYGELFRDLDIQGDTLSDFKDLLVDKMMVGMEAGMGMLSASSSGEDRLDAAQRVEESTGMLDERIRDFLGDEDYDVYRQFEDTMPERMQVDMFKQTLREEDQPDWQQQHELVLAMHEERNKFQFFNNVDPANMLDPATLNASSMELLIEDMSELHERYLDRAAEILTPTQLEQFQTTLDQSLSMQKASMEMATRMFAPSGGAAP